MGSPVSERKLVLLIVALRFAVCSSMVTCNDLQYLELFHPGTIQCSFEARLSLIKWFNSTEDETPPIITLIDMVKGGAGYISGEYDISSNGSLIIKRVTTQHERIFSVLLQESEDEPIIQYNVKIKTIVKPKDSYPTIVQCQGQAPICFTVFNQTSMECFLKGIRPQPILMWGQRFEDGDVQLSSNVAVTPENEGTFSVIASLNPTTNLPMLSAFVCKAISREGLFTEDEKVIILENKSAHPPAVSLRVHFELHSTMILPCTEANLIIWQRLHGADSETDILIIQFSTWKQHFTETFQEGLSLERDGSLVFQQSEWHHAGVYACLATDQFNGNINLVDVVIFVNPDPPHLLIEGCNHQQYCSLEVQKEGTLTCSIHRVRPQVGLQWRTVDTGAVISLEQHQVNTTDNGETYDVTVTATFQVTSPKERLSLECSTVGPNADIFSFSTRIDLLLPYAATDIGWSHGTLLIIVGSSFVGVTICILLVVSFTVLRSRHSRKSEGGNTEEKVPMVKRKSVTSKSKEGEDFQTEEQQEMISSQQVEEPSYTDLTNSQRPSTSIDEHAETMTVDVEVENETLQGNDGPESEVQQNSIREGSPSETETSSSIKEPITVQQHEMKSLETIKTGPDSVTDITTPEDKNKINYPEKCDSGKNISKSEIAKEEQTEENINGALSDGTQSYGTQHSNYVTSPPKDHTEGNFGTDEPEETTIGEAKWKEGTGKDIAKDEAEKENISMKSELDYYSQSTPCTMHKDQMVTFFCLTCEHKACSSCLLMNSHKKDECDLISLENAAGELSKRRKELPQKIEEIQASSKMAWKLWREKKELLNKVRNEMLLKINDGSTSLIENIEKSKQKLMKEVDDRETEELHKIIRAKMSIKLLKKETETLLTQNRKNRGSDALNELHSLHGGMNAIAAIQSKLNEETGQLKEDNATLVYTKSANDGKFCTMVVNGLVGSKTLSDTQSVYILDQRKHGLGICLVCIDDENLSKGCWTHRPEINNEDDPVIVSSEELTCSEQRQTLFSIGKTIFTISVAKKKSFYDSIEAIFPLMLVEE